ncbi:MAG: hypothetical protein EB828_03815 [Nitrosopumilus sp. D6]|nr:MAG: hypothetical protein EB828_03815 [Nitrosopumilus sp. D6]
MSRPQKPDPDETVIPGSNHTPALAFAKIWARVCVVVEMWKYLKGFTYSPKSDLVFDVDNLHEALALFRELVRNGKNFLVNHPIYLIAVTCRKNIKVDDTLKDGYEKILKISNQPLIGYWNNSEGSSYLDAVVALQFISTNAAIREGKKHGQE